MAINVTNVIEFCRQLQQFEHQANLGLANITKMASSAIFDKVLERSPVRTGQFLSNWRTSLETPTESFVPVAYGGSEEESRGPAESQARSRSQAVLAGVKAFSRVYIVNATPYALDLEWGKSKQAPNGMAVVSVEEVAEWLRSAGVSVNVKFSG